MSARRLAIRQPETFTLSSAAKKEIDMWVKKYPKERQRSALIPALWIAQKDAGGWLPEPALRLLGDMLDMAYIASTKSRRFIRCSILSLSEHILCSFAGQRRVGCEGLTI